MDSPIRIYTQGAAAHARDYGPFSLLKPVRCAADASPTGARARGDALAQRARDHERAVALERQRGSYRTIQRVFNTSLHWCQLNWLLIRHHLLDADDVVLMSGDHVVVTKSGKTTYGLDRFFSSLYGKAVPGLCFLSLSLLSVKRRTSYPVVTEQVSQPCETSVQERSKKKAGGPRGRPKGSQNRNRREVALSPSLCFIQNHIKRLLEHIGDACKVVYFIFDGELGHNDAMQMVRQVGLHLMSKLRYN
jgi:putative transposase